MSNYTNLDTLIREYAGWQTAEPADIQTWLNEEITTIQTNYQNGKQLMKLLTTEVANALCNALEAAGLKLVVYSLASETGLNFGDEETQRMLDALGAGDPTFAPYVAGLKALGLYTATRWVRHSGPGEVPTLEQIAERVTIQNGEDLKRENRAWFTSVLEPLVVSTINNGATLAELKTAIAGALQ